MVTLHPTLYKQDSKGKIRIYYIEQDKENYRMITGVLDGALVFSKWTTALPKNIGKSNATTGEEQATLEIKARYTKKLAEHYCSKIEDAKAKKHKFFSPMLATSEEAARFTMVDGKPVIVDPKLDGMRMTAGNVDWISRKGKEIPAARWIYENLSEFFEQNPTIRLDGEIYNHEYRNDFQSLMKICRRTKLTDADIETAKSVLQFHIYDMVDESSPKMTNLERKRWLDNSSLVNIPKIVIVDWDIANTKEELKSIFDKHLSDGYEGSIIRNPDGIYVNKRSKDLIKHKEFFDEEFQILEILPGKGNRSDIAGSIVVKINDNMSCGCGIKGSWKYAEDLLNNKDSYIGKYATVRYFEKTDDGNLRFPVVVDIDRPD
jgi:DNA ligase-1